MGKTSSSANPQSDPAMKNSASFDPEPLQTLLASAYMVQGSGMQPQVLARIMQIQKSIETRDFDLSEVLEAIAEQVRHIAPASGVAIALLRKGQLVYGAGCGSAASYVGRSVAATLSTSGSHAMTSEILRVENADNDPRIQAAICRQFGAKSLLILPVRSQGTVTAVLQIIFDEAHFFADEEVRAYWVFAGLIGDTVRASQPAVEASPTQTTVRDKAVTKPAAAKAPSAIPTVAMPTVPISKPTVAPVAKVSSSEAPPPSKASPVPKAERIPITEPVPKPERVPGPELVPPIAWLKQPAPKTDSAATSQLKGVRLPRFPIQAYPYFKRAWDAGIAVAIVGALITLVSYRERPSVMATAPENASYKAGTTQTPAPDAPAKPLVQDPVAQIPAQHRLAHPSQRLAYTSNVRVRHFGDDVTVRYFTPQSVVVRTNASENQVRHISDDVTVRYFKPRDAAQSSQ